MKSSFLKTAAFVLILVNIGCSKNKTQLKAEKVNITGNAKEYIEVIPGTYEMSLAEKTISVPIKIKTILQFDQTEIDKEYTNIGNLSLQLLDKNGNPLSMTSGISFGPGSTGDWGKVKELLTSQAGTEQTINFEYGGILASESDLSNLMSNAVGFEIVNADITNTVSELNQRTGEINEVEDNYIGHWYEVGNRNHDMQIKREDGFVVIIVNGKTDKAHLESGNLVTTEDGKKIEISYNTTDGRITVNAGEHSMEFEK